MFQCIDSHNQYYDTHVNPLTAGAEDIRVFIFY